MSGSLPDDAPLGSALTNLALSHNLLKGNIPLVFQERPWSELDLSFNRLSGTLSAAMNVGQEVVLRLHKNRLSGMSHKS